VTKTAVSAQIVTFVESVLVALAVAIIDQENGEMCEQSICRWLGWQLGPATLRAVPLLRRDKPEFDISGVSVKQTLFLHSPFCAVFASYKFTNFELFSINCT
jgi:hypothetical protein